MVIATEDNTGVDVYYTYNGVTIPDEHITLQKYEVFTRDTYYMTSGDSIDFTGTQVLATKPVSVYSGDGWIKLAATVSRQLFLCNNNHRETVILMPSDSLARYNGCS